jgi:hypothetical protein
MSHDAMTFRERYLATVSPRYSRNLHAGFVGCFGIFAIFMFLGSVHHVRSLECLAIPVAIVVFNWGEYYVHKKFGHKKSVVGRLFYKRHTGDHHSFFSGSAMYFEQPRDWRVVLFPAWLIVLFVLGMVPVWWLLSRLNANAAALFASTLLCSYLCYEFFHVCAHLPSEYRITRLPWIRHVRCLHAVHHRRDLMEQCNFNIVFPLMDWIYGTLCLPGKANSRVAAES